MVAFSIGILGSVLGAGRWRRRLHIPDAPTRRILPPRAAAACVSTDTASECQVDGCFGSRNTAMVATTAMANAPNDAAAKA